MNRSYRTEAIVVRRVNLGEADRILTLFTRDRGKISVVAKGCRRGASSMSGATELCSYASFQLAMGANLDVVTQVELKTAFLALRGSLDRISRAMYALEFCNEFLEERQPQPDLFDLLLSALYVIQKAQQLDWTVAGFELQAMSILGYAPQLDVCSVCGRPGNAAECRFSAVLGGILCEACGPSRRESVIVSPAAGAALRRMMESQLPALGCEEAPAALAIEVRRLMRSHVRHRAEKEFKSVRFIEQLRAEEASRSQEEHA